MLLVVLVLVMLLMQDLHLQVLLIEMEFIVCHAAEVLVRRRQLLLLFLAGWHDYLHFLRAGRAFHSLT